MKDTKNCTMHTMQLTLSNEDGTSIPLTVQFEVKGDEVVGLRGVPEEGEAEYEVSFIVRPKGQSYGCFVCIKPPCPPNVLQWMSPCPYPED